jgi:predicted TIM-barrel fold metal-dependent hydrolase
MSENWIGRRAFLQGAASLAALGAAGIISAEAGQMDIAVPNSTGTAPPKLKLPALTCDTHQHIYDDVLFPPPVPPVEPNSTVADYRLLQKRIGVQRNIVVTPGPYATDNRVTLDAIAKFGKNARGVAVVNDKITDAELQALHKGGIRGIRFANPAPGRVTTVEMIEPLSKRINELGWHVDFNLSAEETVKNEDLLMRLPSQIIFDHMGHLPQPAGVNHPAYAVIQRLINKGRTWVKLSVTANNPPATYDQINMVAAAYLKEAPERMVWGSNWPHPSEKVKPDDSVVVDLVSNWTTNEKVLHRMFVENAEVLYGFPKSA